MPSFWYFVKHLGKLDILERVFLRLTIYWDMSVLFLAKQLSFQLPYPSRPLPFPPLPLPSRSKDCSSLASCFPLWLFLCTGLTSRTVSWRVHVRALDEASLSPILSPSPLLCVCIHYNSSPEHNREIWTSGAKLLFLAHIYSLFILHIPKSILTILFF